MEIFQTFLDISSLKGMQKKLKKSDHFEITPRYIMSEIWYTMFMNLLVVNLCIPIDFDVLRWLQVVNNSALPS